MTLLDIIRAFCHRTNGIAAPSAILGSSDPSALQLMALLEEVGNDLATRGHWSALVREATFTTLAAESQGTLASMTGDGFSHIINNTIWNRTTGQAMRVIDAADWQANKAIVANGAPPFVRLRGGKLIAFPVPVAGQTWAFEYVSTQWITDSTGVLLQTTFASDTDVPLLPATLLLAGLRAWFKKEKGLEYSEDFRAYEMQVAHALSRDGFHGSLSMNSDNTDRRPGVLIPPAESWFT